MPSDAETKAHLEGIWAVNKHNSPIYAFLLSDVQFTTVSQGLVTARLQLTKNHINSKGGLHGSVSATLVDWVGGYAIASWDCRERMGVSVDIHVTYISSAGEGDWIEVEGRANKVGKSLAFTTARISKVVDGQAGPVIATASHTKYFL